MTTYFYVLTHWNSPSGERGWHPDIDQFTTDWEDVTHQSDVSKITLNAVLFRCRFPGDDLTSLLSHPDYGEGAIIHIEHIDDETGQRINDIFVADEQFEKQRTLLETKGVTKEQLNAALGETVKQRDSKDISEQLILWLKADGLKPEVASEVVIEEVTK